MKMDAVPEGQLTQDVFTNSEKALTDDEKQKLEEQNKRLIPDFKARQLENQVRYFG